MSGLFADDPVSIANRRSAVLQGEEAAAHAPPTQGFDPLQPFNAIGRGLYSGLGTVAQGGTDTLHFFAGADDRNYQSMFGNIRPDGTVIGDTENPMETVTRQAGDAVAQFRADVRPDPAHMDAASNILYGLTETLTAGGVGALAGPAGAVSALGAGYGSTSYREQIDQGVDPETASEVAFREGAFMGASALLPASMPGRFLTRAVSGAAINTGVGIAQNEAIGSYLRAHGYDEQAKRYDWHDANALVSSAVIGAAFGGLMGHGHEVAPADGEPHTNPVDATVEALRNGSLKPDQDVIDAAMTVQRESQFQTGSGVLALDADGESILTERQSRLQAQAENGEDLDAGPLTPEEASHFAPAPEPDEQHQTLLYDALDQIAKDEGLPDDVVAELRAHDARAGAVRAALDAERQARGLGPGEALFSYGGRPRTANDSVPEENATEAGTGRKRKVMVTDYNQASYGRIIDEALKLAEANGGRLPRGYMEHIAASTGYAPVSVKHIISESRIGLFGEELKARALGLKGAPSGRVQNRDIVARLMDQGLESGVIRERLNNMRREMGLEPSSRETVNATMSQVRRARREGNSLYSMGELEPFYSAVERATSEALQHVAEQEFGATWNALSKAGNVHIVETRADVPSAYGIPSGVKAVHLRDSGETYFIARNIRPEDMKGLILHEVGVHHGMRDMLGDRGFKSVLRQIERMVEEGHPAVLDARARAELHTKDAPEQTAEETLAYLVEHEADLPIVNRVLASVRQWLLKTFGSTFGARLTVDDIRQLALASLRRVARQAERSLNDVTPLRNDGRAMSAEEQAILASKSPDAGGGGLEQDSTLPDGGGAGVGQSPLDAEGNPVASSVYPFGFKRQGGIGYSSRQFMPGEASSAFPDEGINIAGVPSTEESVSIPALTPTQPRVSDNFANQNRPTGGANSPFTDMPAVYRQGGDLFILDGHNRIAAAAARGENNIKVRVFDAANGARPNDPESSTYTPVTDWNALDRASAVSVARQNRLNETSAIDLIRRARAGERLPDKQRQIIRDMIMADRAAQSVNPHSATALERFLRGESPAPAPPSAGSSDKPLFSIGGREEDERAIRKFEDAPPEIAERVTPRSFAAINKVDDKALLTWYQENVTEGRTANGDIALRFRSEEKLANPNVRIELVDHGESAYTALIVFRGRTSRALAAYRKPSRVEVAKALHIFTRTMAVTKAWVIKNQPTRIAFTGATAAHDRLYRAAMRTMKIEGYENREVVDTNAQAFKHEENGPVNRVSAAGNPHTTFMFVRNDIAAREPRAGVEQSAEADQSPWAAPGELRKARTETIIHRDANGDFLDNRRPQDAAHTGGTNAGGDGSGGAGARGNAPHSRDEGIFAAPRADYRVERDAYQALDPVHQALADEPDMKLPTENGEVSARDAIIMSEEAQKRAREMKDGYQAAIKCAIRHGGNLSSAYAADIVAGQGLGLLAGVPVALGISAAIGASNRQQNTPERLRARAHEAGVAAGMDEPMGHDTSHAVPFSDVVEPDAPEPAAPPLDASGVAPGEQADGARVPPVPASFGQGGPEEPIH